MLKQNDPNALHVLPMMGWALMPIRKDQQRLSPGITAIRKFPGIVQDE